MLRIIVAGGRDFNNYELLKQTVNQFISDNSEANPYIVCGRARGADTLGEKFAREYSYKIRYYLADWSTYGKSAGFVRNVEMAENADALVAFWDGNSPGTKHMIKVAKEKKLDVRVKRYTMHKKL